MISANVIVSVLIIRKDLWRKIWEKSNSRKLKMNVSKWSNKFYRQGFNSLVKDTENEVVVCVPYTDLFYALLTAQGTNMCK